MTGSDAAGAAVVRAPSFGRSMLAHWELDPEILYLNHGTVGAPPRRVLEAQRSIRAAVEKQPARVLVREQTGLMAGSPPAETGLRAAARRVAEFVGARGEDLVFVENVTTGINAVLRSLRFEPGDEILLTDHAYGAVANAARHRARECGARVVVAELPPDLADPAAAVEAVAARLSSRTRLAVVDHVTSESAWILNVRDVAARCRDAGVPVLVDGAHAPGAIALDVPSLGVDWYAANLHKWAMAPRSCGFLWAHSDRQADLHPTVISWGLGRGFLAEFDWTGTRDVSPFLAAPEGIAFMRWLGEERMRAWNHRLAWEGAAQLTRRLRTEIPAPETAIGTMATVPLPARAGGAPEDAARLRDALLYEDRIEVQVHAWRGRLWVRISGQVYNDIDDILRLGEAVARRLHG